jgi:hypothetical protein
VHTPTTSDLITIAHRHDDALALSAYVSVPPTSPDSLAHARIALSNGIAESRSALGAASHLERAMFEAAAARLLESLTASAQSLRGRTWIGFAVADDTHYVWSVAGELPASLPAVVSWGRGLGVGPYFALRPGRSAVAVLLDHQRASFFRVDSAGAMEETTRFETTPKVPTGDHTSAPPRQSFHVGTRGTPAADSAAVQAAAAWERHRARMRTELARLPATAQIYIGGATDAVTELVGELPLMLRGRITLLRGAHFGSTVPALRAAIEEKARDERIREEGELVSETLARARGTALGVLGFGPVNVALAQRAVDTLVVSDRLLRDDPPGFERMIRTAVRQNARVHVVHDGAAALLQSAATGIAARLRFVINAPQWVASL